MFEGIIGHIAQPNCNYTAISPMEAIQPGLCATRPALLTQKFTEDLIQRHLHLNFKGK